ncbi:MAG: homocysteine S-methyltransferase family protein [Gemmataceae bacterium]|nr:homocysteine S-methyltransferase family protein [Gemmataceae bacterium]
MGTELQRAGIQPGECYEQWNLTHPEQVRGIHQAYADAGADVLLANTFQANPLALRRFRLGNQIEAIHEAGIRLASEAAKRKRFVVASIGPIGPPETAWQERETMQEVVQSLRRTEGDLSAILLETWSHQDFLAEADAALYQLAHTKDEIPVLLSLSFMRMPDGSYNDFRGRALHDFVRRSAQRRPAALGVNCGRDIGMDDAIEIVRRYRQFTDLPIFVRPNAGTPRREGDAWVYPQTPAMMAERLPELLEAGVSMVGGCCGTTPAHIAAFRPIVGAWNARQTPA